MFVVNRPDKEDTYWEIIYVETNEVVASISESWSYSTGTKKELKVKDKVIGRIKNQREAVEKTKDFFDGIKENIRLHEKHISEIIEDISIIKHERSKEILEKELFQLKKYLENIQQYNLI